MVTVLGDKMRALAEAGHLKADELREKATAFDEAFVGFYDEPQIVTVKQFMGCWARARICWSAYSDEPLI